MPEISDAEYRTFVRFQELGSIEDVSKKLQKHAEVLEDNRKYRQEEKPALEAKLPKEGEVVLPKAKADALAAYEALGKPEEVTSKLSEAGQAKAELAKRQRQDAHAAAAKALGMPDASAKLLTRLLPEDASVEVKTDKDGDKDVQVAYITLSGEGQQPKKLTDHLTAELDADTVKLLQGSGTQQQDKGTGGTQWGRQAPTGGGVKDEKLSPEQIEARKRGGRHVQYNI